MRSYVGVAVHSTTLEEEPEDLLRLEFDGVREVDLGDAKVTLMLLRWASDESPESSFLRSLIAMDAEEEAD